MNEDWILFDSTIQQFPNWLYAMNRVKNHILSRSNWTKGNSIQKIIENKLNSLKRTLGGTCDYSMDVGWFHYIPRNESKNAVDPIVE